MDRFYDWLRRKKGISKCKFDNFDKEKRMALRQEYKNGMDNLITNSFIG